MFLLDATASSRKSGEAILWASPGSIGLQSVAGAWHKNGLAGLRQVSGPWSVVLYDRKADQHIAVADPLGIQPLYWARTRKGGIAFGAILADLVDRQDVEDSLDYEGILLDQLRHHLPGGGTSSRTSFATVSGVPGGHALRIRADGSTGLERYWDAEELPGPERTLTLGACADLLRERVETAVRRLVPGNATVGAHVSGGLDCTSVACLAHRVLSESGSGLVAGYSWAPSEAIAPSFAGDERALLHDVQAASGFPVRTIGPQEEGEWFWRLDPVRYPNTDHQLECRVLEQAQRDGVGILLSGWGGDEVASFNGRTVVGQLLRKGRVGAAERELTQRFALNRGRHPVGRERARRLAGAAASALTGTARSKLRNGGGGTVDARAREIEDAIRAFSPMAAELYHQNRRAASSSYDHHEMQILLLRNGHLQRRIAGWHQTGHLMGIQYRYPLLDLGVVEAALRMPWWAFHYKGWARAAFRLAVEPWVPASVAWNVAKYEPALFWPPGGGIDTRALANRRRHLDDPQYEAVMALATLMRDGRSATLPSHLRVTARPDLALRA